ncbi:hypothetical protein T439DRAFT_324672 [Meredithblackwellia eburnea MCA 4105]
MSPPVFDVLGVGFGPANLAIAIAVQEYNSCSAGTSPPSTSFSDLGGLQNELRGNDVTATPDASHHRSASPSKLKVCFVEKFERFKWHPGMMLEGSRMQISFLKDLATMRNPSSTYTFLSYLHNLSPSRLLSFVSLATFTPTRSEFADYLGWCAERVEKELEDSDSQIAYGEEVVFIDHVPNEDGSAVKLLRITSRCIRTGRIVHRHSKNVIISVGGYPKVPKLLSVPSVKSTGRIIHSANFLDRVDNVLGEIVESFPQDRPVRIAVVGGGQSASEVFLAVQVKLRLIMSHLGKVAKEGMRPTVELFIRGMSLKGTEESQFSNEVFDPAMSQVVFGLLPAARKKLLRDSKSTNYSVVNPETLETIYNTMYSQKVDEDVSARSKTPKPTSPKLVIHPYSTLSSAEIAQEDPKCVRLKFSNSLTSFTTTNDVFDVVFCGTGYGRQGWRDLVFPKTGNVDGGGLGVLFPSLNRSSFPFQSTFNESSFSLPTRVMFSGRTTPSSASSSPPLSTSSSSTGASTTASSSPPSRQSCEESEVESKSSSVQILQNYRVDLPSECHVGGNRVGFEPTIWIQGANEETHGVSDSLLSVLAVRSGEIVRSLLDEGNFKS